jgi:hypothetical protein
MVGRSRTDRRPDAYSFGEVIRHKEFDRMTQGELRDAERLIDLLAPRLEKRPTRRHELHRHGRILAPRIMFRRNLATGGDLVEWVWRRPTRRARPIVVLCDISGSMERQSRLLLRFVQALSRSPVKTEAFVFGNPADPSHPADSRPRSGSRPGARLGGRLRLGRRDADRRSVPRVQPALGQASPAHERRGDRRQRRVGSWRHRPRPRGDGAAVAQLSPPDLAQPPPAPTGTSPRRRDGGRVSVHRRFRRGRDDCEPRTPGRAAGGDARGQPIRCPAFGGRAGGVPGGPRVWRARRVREPVSEPVSRPSTDAASIATRPETVGGPPPDPGSARALS